MSPPHVKQDRHLPASSRTTASSMRVRVSVSIWSKANARSPWLRAMSRSAGFTVASFMLDSYVTVPAFLEECSDFTSEAGKGSLDPMPVRVTLLLYNAVILTFGCFPTIQRRWMNVKGSDVMRSNKRHCE